MISMAETKASSLSFLLLLSIILMMVLSNIIITACFAEERSIYIVLLEGDGLAFSNTADSPIHPNRFE